MLVVNDFVLDDLVVVQVFTYLWVERTLDDEMLQENVFPKIFRDKALLQILIDLYTIHI